MRRIKLISRVHTVQGAMPASAFMALTPWDEYKTCLTHEKSLSGKKECYAAYRDAISEEE